MCRPCSNRHGFTAIELWLAITLTVFIVGSIGALLKAVENSFEYTESYGAATQHARVALERITRNVNGATASEQFPGILILSNQDGTATSPGTLIVWHPSGTAANPTGLPLYKELVIYAPNPTTPNQLVEFTTPSDGGTVPNYTDTTSWTSAVNAIKTSANTQKVVLTDRLRTAQASPSTPLRGAIRFEARLTPSQASWTSHCAGTTAWNQLVWPQGLYGSQYGLRQVWLRIEMQVLAVADLQVVGTAGLPTAPFFGSATISYPLQRKF